MRGWLLTIAVIFLPISSSWAGLACFEKSTGKWLGEYCDSCTVGTCAENWVTKNPQYGYTADQIEERTVTEQGGNALVRQADQPILDATKALDAKRKAALASGDVKLRALGFTEEEIAARDR